ncbi:hypothetical protein DMUE_0665 [Dictyocoela muelleri]|nr:hypothetical protein DMUE_0665 [Dictyocoela muelleri]
MNHEKIIGIKSQRNGRKILLNGYAYNYHRVKDQIITWRCINRKCPGIIKTYSGDDVKIITVHKCEQNFDKNEAMFLNFNTIKRSIETNERPRDIFIGEMKMVPSTASRFLPNEKNHTDKLTKIRRKNNIIKKRKIFHFR